MPGRPDCARDEPHVLLQLEDAPARHPAESGAVAAPARGRARELPPEQAGAHGGHSRALPQRCRRPSSHATNPPPPSTLRQTPSPPGQARASRYTGARCNSKRASARSPSAARIASGVTDALERTAKREPRHTRPIAEIEAPSWTELNDGFVTGARRGCAGCAAPRAQAPAHVLLLRLHLHPLRLCCCCSQPA